jgi:hypothetical protein
MGAVCSGATSRIEDPMAGMRWLVAMSGTCTYISRMPMSRTKLVKWYLS